MPTGKRGPVVYVSYKISQQLVRTTDANGSFMKQKTVVHSIDAEADQKIGLGDYDLVVGDEVLRDHAAGRIGEGESRSEVSVVVKVIFPVVAESGGEHKVFAQVVFVLNE